MIISMLIVGLSPYKVFVRATPEAPKTTQSIATALGCPPELGDKTLWLEIQYTYRTQRNQAEIDMVAFIVPEDAMQADEGEKPLTVLLTSKPFMLHFWAAN